MRKIAPRWQFVILLAVVIILWCCSTLVHRCQREDLESRPDVLPSYPVVIENDSTSFNKLKIDSADVKKKSKKKKSSLDSGKIGKHGPIERNFLDEEIPIDEVGHR